MYKQNPEDIEIYNGERGYKFEQLIKNILRKGKLKDKYINVLTDSKGMELYDMAFTHITANRERNSEFFELLGDSTLNKAIVWYLYRRFPQLNCTEGVKIVARLKINLVSKKTFAEIGQSLGIWPYISANMEIRENKMKPALEDCFEAFIGVTEHLLDSRIKIGTGYAICYSIIESLFNDIDISLEYNDLVDAKTRLKELFDFYGHKLGKLEYSAVRNKEEKISNVIAYMTKDFQKMEIGDGSASLKNIATQRAAEKSLEFLKTRGFSRPVPDDYKKFCNK